MTEAELVVHQVEHTPTVEEDHQEPADDAMSLAMLRVLQCVVGTQDRLGTELSYLGALLNDPHHSRILAIIRSTQVERLTWEYFLDAFQNKYVHTWYVEARRLEFTEFK
ncbi:hypothetical protein EPI10_016178 [Gossypium australe]|uniref:Uncharacterized protein n=1 Tax=Gossypium australe TaxID=47621 RepID=A0A5B6VMH4_9ROSI|nr:hypothetical protein EPI10_016178 [Gossypium australe]